jgi:hypothetical protein
MKNIRSDVAVFFHKHRLSPLVYEVIKCVTQYKERDGGEEHDIKEAINFCKEILQEDYDISTYLDYTEGDTARIATQVLEGNSAEDIQEIIDEGNERWTTTGPPLYSDSVKSGRFKFSVIPYQDEFRIVDESNAVYKKIKRRETADQVCEEMNNAT